MYNRYIPQPDGSYRRSRVPEQNPPPQPPRPASPPEQHYPKPEPCAPECIHASPGKSAPCSRPVRRPQRPPCPPPRQEYPQPASVGQFLKGLLPKDFDTSDLLIVLLLLLMSADCQEDQNTALLTLVLYLFL